MRSSFPTSHFQAALGTLCLTMLLGAVNALASGGQAPDVKAEPEQGRSTAKPNGAAQDDMTTCAKGLLWDARRKTCVHMRRGALPDDAMADDAYALAKAERYGEALAVLDLMQDGNTAEALNYRGYATRKLGQVDQGIAYYQRAVALDPGYAKVREYLGEAYVIKGRLDLAREQLGAIQSICGMTCEPYRELRDALSRRPPI